MEFYIYKWLRRSWKCSPLGRLHQIVHHAGIPGFIPASDIGLVWWFMLTTPALGRQKWEDHELQASLHCTVSSGIVWGTYCPVPPCPLFLFFSRKTSFKTYL